MKKDSGEKLDMIKIAICSDSIEYSHNLEKCICKRLHLEEGDKDNDIDSYNSALLNNNLRQTLKEYSLVFISCMLDNIDTLELISEIREDNPNTAIVLIEADLVSAMEGYKIPVYRCFANNEIDLQTSVNECIDSFIKDKMELNSCSFKFREGKKYIDLENLIYVESSSHVVTFYTLEDTVKTYTLMDSLDNVENIINSMLFVRVHKSFLVNAKYIKSIEAYNVILFNQKIIPVSRKRYVTAKKIFNMLEKEGFTCI